jgi:kynureninase
MDSLLQFREHFPILQKTNYLISNSLGAMPHGAREGLANYADTWEFRGVRAWAEGWWESPVRVGNLVAPLIGAKPGTVSMHQNLTILSGILLSAFEITPQRNKIVYESLNFPSIKYLYQNMARGAEIVEVPSDDGIQIDTQRMIDAIDERTLLVPMSHVLFRSAYIQDAKAICEKANRVGAHVILDAYQSVGVVPVDVEDIQPSFLIGGCLKWLCGGPGNCFLWVREDLAKTLAPRLTGWMSHQRPFAFEDELVRREDAFRFLNGTPNVPALAAAESGLQIVAAAGSTAIREKSIRQTAWLMKAARERGFRVNTPEDAARRGGTVSIDPPFAYEVSRALLAREIIVDFRAGAGIRVSPHFYTSDDELQQAMEAIDEILESKSYEQFLGGRGLVT